MLNETRRHWSTVGLLSITILGGLGMGCVRHSEEALTWCGPATAQMIIENDDKSGCPDSILQEDLWAIIEAERVDAAWDADPVGMAKALKRSCTGWNWSVLANANETAFMRGVAYFMQHYEYPAAVVLNTLPHNGYAAHAEHWVDVIGAGTTPAATLPAAAVTLDWVIYVDPAPPAFGGDAILDVVSGSTWYARLRPVAKPTSSYNGKYVAVVEPPETTGRAVARAERVMGNIVPATGVAQQALRQLRTLASDPRVAAALRKYDVSGALKAYGLPEATAVGNIEKAQPLEPLLVNRRGGAYYVVPLAFDRSTGEAQAAVAINAYDGSFQELGLFRAVRYLKREQVIENARKLPELAQLATIEAEPVFDGATATAHKLLPVWSVKGDGRTFEFDARGNQVRARPVVAPTPTGLPGRPQ